MAISMFMLSFPFSTLTLLTQEVSEFLIKTHIKYLSCFPNKT